MRDYFQAQRVSNNNTVTRPGLLSNIGRIQRWANETLNVAPCPSLLLLASFSAPVVINPLHCFLQGKVIGGTFSWEKLIQLSLMG